jgi:hypothetical protein
MERKAVIGRIARAIAFIVVASLAAAPGIRSDDDPDEDHATISPLAVPCTSMPHPYSESGDIVFDPQSGLITFGWSDGEATTLDVRDADCQPGIAEFVEAEQTMSREIQAQSCVALRELVENLRRKHGPSMPTVTVIPDDYADAGDPGSAQKMRTVGPIPNFDLAGAERTLRRDC